MADTSRQTQTTTTPPCAVDGPYAEAHAEHMSLNGECPWCGNVADPASRWDS